MSAQANRVKKVVITTSDGSTITIDDFADAELTVNHHFAPYTYRKDEFHDGHGTRWESTKATLSIVGIARNGLKYWIKPKARKRRSKKRPRKKVKR
jgi:hypothetical protein